MPQLQAASCSMSGGIRGVGLWTLFAGGMLLSCRHPSPSRLACDTQLGLPERQEGLCAFPLYLEVPYAPSVSPFSLSSAIPLQEGTGLFLPL